ncbi:MAG TPA: NADPH-dependent FMN reductase [Povalibacter sp.]|uniref:NADPH-dependent FMN reductase n=1 Tax=Povalibacter sp. TaxID=1962978 RepID=UPI002C526E02|nr:NADPH-dependent FMN reductase [Povalibacter sp.]HMN45065.1 NADPH-dependent FMN reductase [Povalibacter sp.]
MPANAHPPRIIGIGGTTKPGSSTERTLTATLQAAERLGAQTMLFAGPVLAQLPLYSPEDAQRSELQRQFVEAVRHADGLILATPAYHAGISGLLKNAIDLLEDLRGDVRPYLHDRAVGCIVTAHGWQGAGTTLTSVRTIVHALRGWPTPLGITLNTAERLFDDEGDCLDERVQVQFAMLAAQVVGFANRMRH